jgi:hypothetical protein
MMYEKTLLKLAAVFSSWIFAVHFAAAGAMAQSAGTNAVAAAAASNPITIENARPGTSQWKLNNPALQHQIEGYVSATSFNRGETVSIYVNTAASTFNLDVFRMGYYNGAGARHVYSAANLKGGAQRLPCLNPDGVIECDWNVSHAFTVPATTDPTQSNYWTSGVYLARIMANDSARNDSYMIFVVRDDVRNASFVAQLPITTYQAYNYWGGKSLYTGCVNHTATWACPDGQANATAVSFSRPFTPSSNPAAAYGAGAGEFLTNVQTVQEGYPISSAAFDYNMVRWIEKQGLDVKYITNLDLHRDQNVLHDAMAFVSFGHDEYYSSAMWNNLVAARNAGINLAFFSSNQIYWRVRFGPDFQGRPNRTMLCYKYVQDPIAAGDFRTGLFRDLGKPEAALIGGQYVAAPVTGDITVTNASHWLFSGSGASNTTVLRGLLGYEVNAIAPAVSPANVESLAHTTGDGFESDVSYYVAPSSAQVFATGSMAWAWGLDDYFANGLRQNYASPIAQKVTANVFDALSEANLDTFVNAASRLFLATPEGSLNPVQVVQNTAPTGLSKSNKWRVIPTTSGTVRLVSRSTGLCLDAYGAVAGSVVGVWNCNGGPNQEWTPKDMGNGYVALQDQRSGLCVDAPSSTAAGTGLALAACAQRSSQLWFRTATGGSLPPIPTSPTSDITPNVPITLSDENNVNVLSLSDLQAAPLTQFPTAARPDYSQWRPTTSNDSSYFKVISLANGLCLDAYGLASGAEVGTWECNGGEHQNWRFVPLGNSVYTLADQRSGLCVTRDGASGVRLTACQALANQRWLKTEPSVAVPTMLTFTNAASQYFLAIPANTSASSLVAQAPTSAGFANLWQATSLGDGYLRLTSTTNGLCLDAYGTTDGASVGTWECHQEDQQRWKFIESNTGFNALTDKRSGKCVGNGGASTEGASLVLESCNNNLGQLWQRQTQ